MKISSTNSPIPTTAADPLSPKRKRLETAENFPNKILKDQAEFVTQKRVSFAAKPLFHSDLSRLQEEELRETKLTNEESVILSIVNQVMPNLSEPDENAYTISLEENGLYIHNDHFKVNVDDLLDFLKNKDPSNKDYYKEVSCITECVISKCDKVQKYIYEMENSLYCVGSQTHFEVNEEYHNDILNLIQKDIEKMRRWNFKYGILGQNLPIIAKDPNSPYKAFIEQILDLLESIIKVKSKDFIDDYERLLLITYKFRSLEDSLFVIPPPGSYFFNYRVLTSQILTTLELHTDTEISSLAEIQHQLLKALYPIFDRYIQCKKKVYDDQISLEKFDEKYTVIYDEIGKLKKAYQKENEKIEFSNAILHNLALIFFTIQNKLCSDKDKFKLARSIIKENS